MYAFAYGLGARASDATEVYPLWDLSHGWIVSLTLSQLTPATVLADISQCVYREYNAHDYPDYPK